VWVFWLGFKAIGCQDTAKATCQEYAQSCKQIDKGSIVGRLVRYRLGYKDERVKHPKYATSKNYSQRAAYENNQPGM
jgi:hypothetical protein